MKVPFHRSQDQRKRKLQDWQSAEGQSIVPFSATTAPIVHSSCTSFYTVFEGTLDQPIFTLTTAWRFLQPPSLSQIFPCQVDLFQCVFFQLLFLGAWFSHAFGVPVSFLGFHFACLLFSDIGILSRRCSESFPSSTFQRSISTGRHIEFQWLSLSQNSLQLIDACVLGSCFEKLLR